MDHKTALAKIRKCLALSKSSEPHEAAAALRQAQKLMAEFGLSDGDMELADVQQHARSATDGAVSQWQAQLGNLIAKAFGCDYIWAREARLVGWKVAWKRQIVFYGPDAAAEVAAYVWDVLFRQAVRARTAHIKAQPRNCKPATKTGRGDLFALGWVAGVRALVERMATGGERRQQLLDSYAAAAWPSAKTVKPTRRDVGRNVRLDDFGNGMAAGRSAELNRGVGGAPAVGLIAG